MNSASNLIFVGAFLCLVSAMSSAQDSLKYFPAPDAPMSPINETYLVNKPVSHEYEMYLQTQDETGDWVQVAGPNQRSYTAQNNQPNAQNYRILYRGEGIDGGIEEVVSPQITVGALRFSNPEDCATSQPRQNAERETSLMAYGAISPTFNTLEHIGNVTMNGALAADVATNESTALFCQECHTPVSVEQGEFISFQENSLLNNGVPRPAVEFMSELGKRGISCDVCHQIESHAIDNPLTSIDDGFTPGNFGGVANSSFKFLEASLGEDGIPVKLGPFAANELSPPLPVHSVEQSEYLSSSKFCGSCHDVRIAAEDTLSGEPFRRLENLYTEWESSPWADADHPDNPIGEEVNCQGCHMSTFPEGAPNEYAQGMIAVSSTESKRITNHFFTGVDIPLVEFPGIDTTKARRQQLLSQAVTIELVLDEENHGPGLLPIAVGLENVGTGHNIPSGFSQERQFWIKIEVRDAQDSLVYESGYLRDSDNDGLINDEDLNNFANMRLTSDLEVEGIEEAGYDLHDFYGADVNQRIFDGEAFSNLGLINFGNEFIRTTFAPHEEVFSPFLATAMENTHSLPPLEKKFYLYDIPTDEPTLGFDIEYPLSVQASLHFRPFPPRFLQGLVDAANEHQLGLNGMDDTLLDKNEIIDMASTGLQVETYESDNRGGKSRNKRGDDRDRYDRRGDDKKEGSRNDHKEKDGNRRSDSKKTDENWGSHLINKAKEFYRRLR